MKNLASAILQHTNCYFDFSKQTENSCWERYAFELRSGNLIKNEIPNSKFGNLTFLKFFPKFIFKFKNINFSLNKNSFTTLYRLNFKTHLNSFIFNFSKFAFTYASYYKKKYFNKRKNN